MELVDIRYLGVSPDYQTYSDQDKNLINRSLISPKFGEPNDYIEYFIYDLNGQIIARNYNVTKYKPGPDVLPTNGTYSSIYLDPEGDARDEGFNRGSVLIKYNFFKLLLDSRPGKEFWIKEVSTSRTEIKVARQDLSNSDLSAAFDQLNGILTNNSYYPDFYLNFGSDIEVIAVNAVYVEEDGTGYILLKLYEPLPFDFDVKSQFWVVQKVAEPTRFQIDIQVEAEQAAELFPLAGPNYAVELNQKAAQSTDYYSYGSLFSTSVSSSYQQLKSFFDEKAITINTDYSNFTNFIHYSSATERVNNFVYKLQLIEYYTSSSLALNSITPGSNTNALVSSSRALLQQNIDNIITKFDGYEHYLYFVSESTAWPKSSNLQPYTLYPTTSSQAINWLGDADTQPTSTKLSILYSASLYDNNNKDGLRYVTPTYIRDDQNNASYLTFLDMIGQHFDNIWIYYKDVTNRFSAENNPNIGISMDLVGDALKGFGVQLYTNTNVADNIYYSLLGINDTGSTLPVTSSGYARVSKVSSSLLPPVGSSYLSASLYLPPFGNEKITRYVTTFVTSSAAVTSSFATLAPSQLESEIYKRLYHNLPYLLKTKGTERGVRALIACYGIPNAALTVNEFGGYDMFSQGDIQGIQDNKIYTGSVLSISSSLLSPYTTNQYYQNNTERNSFDLEVGFSPADSINAHITGTLTNLSVQQLIGDPNLQYSSSYDPLVRTSYTYFSSSYTSRYNVWDFIRIIKYYNNSIFKMIKDYVPARASLTTGIIVKPHILERSKYARHEPTVTTSYITGSTNMVAITGSDPALIKYSTAYIGQTQTVSGSVPINNSYGFEKYTGTFSGSIIQASTNYFPQYEQSYQPVQSLSYLDRVPPIQIPLTATYQNVSGSVKSIKYFDLDYSSNQITPVNYGIITESINNGIASQNNPYAPYAQLQDYNYAVRRSIQPRYSGSTLSGKAYNIYTPGDVSYGNDPVINYYTNKLGLFTQVATSSFLPGAVNATLAYLADVSGGLFELNQQNKNWVDVQNIFKAGATLTIKQFDNKKYSKQQTTDGIKTIYSSGYSYTPLVYFGTGSVDNTLAFENQQGAQAYYASAQNTANNGTYRVIGSDRYYYISGSTSNGHPLLAATASSFFDRTLDGADYFRSGSGATPPSYSIQETGNYATNVSVGFNLIYPDTTLVRSTWALQVIKKVGSTYTLLHEQQQIFTNVPSSVTLTYLGYGYDFTFRFRLSAAIATDIVIRNAYVDTYIGANCKSYLGSDTSIQGTLAKGTVAVAIAGYDTTPTPFDTFKLDATGNTRYQISYAGSPFQSVIYNGTLFQFDDVAITCNFATGCTPQINP